MNTAVKSVEPLDDYKLRLIFGNGEVGVFNLSPYLNIGKFSELKDKSLFNSVKVKFDSIEWPNQLDLDPEFLYEKSIKTKSA